MKPGPSLRTGRAGLPHPALQSVGAYCCDCPCPLVFRCQGQQPTAGKPLVPPALMGRSHPLPGMAPALFQQAAQSAPHVAIHRRKHVAFAVLEIPIPAAHRAVHVGHDGPQAPPVRPQCLGPHALFQLLQALLSWPSHAPLEVIGGQEFSGLRHVGARAAVGMRRFTVPSV